MAINKVILQGRIPFDLELKNADDDKKAFMGFSLSVQRNYKPEGEQYYPEDLIYCKTFGAKAKFFANNFAKGSFVNVEGRLQRDDDYTDKDGKEVKGQMYLHIEEIHFAGGGSKSEKSDTAETKTKKTGSAPASKGTNPLAKTPGANPLAGKGPAKKSPF